MSQFGNISGNFNSTYGFNHISGFGGNDAYLEVIRDYGSSGNAISASSTILYNQIIKRSPYFKYDTSTGLSLITQGGWYIINWIQRIDNNKSFELQVARDGTWNTIFPCFGIHNPDVYMTYTVVEYLYPNDIVRIFATSSMTAYYVWSFKMYLLSRS